MPAGKLMLLRSGAVVRVDGRRRHAPFARIDRPADLIEGPLAFERRRPLQVAQRIVAPDLHRRVVAPLVRIPDAIGDGVQLDLGRALGLLAHPRRRVDVLLHRGLDALDHLERVGLGGRSEGLVDERLAERLAELLIGLRHAALPAGQLLLLPAERAAEEIEVGVGERSRQHLRRCVHELPCQVRL